MGYAICENLVGYTGRGLVKGPVMWIHLASMRVYKSHLPYTGVGTDPADPAAVRPII